MKTILFWCLIALFSGLPIYLLYWNLFRPVLLKRLKYRLYRCRDEVRLLLISRAIGEKEKAYPLVERFCNRAIAQLEDVDLPMLFRHKIDKGVLLEVERDLGTIFESPAPLRQCFIQIVAAVFGAAFANSPGILVLLAPIFFLGVTLLWFNKVKNLVIGLIKRALGSFYLPQVNCPQPA